jgi:hypothetical protein
LNASRAVVQFRVLVHAGTALLMARWISFFAASSLGKCPFVLIAFRG